MPGMDEMIIPGRKAAAQCLCLVRRYGLSGPFEELSEKQVGDLRSVKSEVDRIPCRSGSRWRSTSSD